MTPVLIYSTSWCPFCIRARQLLDRKGVVYTNVDVEDEPGQRATMIARAGRRSVPQIFIGDTHVGGCDDLYALEREGRLDAMLKTESKT